MAIKNWTVKTRQIKKKSKGLINHFNYLFNEDKPSHLNTKIIDLNNSHDKLNNILNEVEERKKYRRENGLRGGGVSNLATSFSLTLPTDIKQPSAKEWQKIAAISLKKVADDIDIDFEKLKKNSVIVLHQEPGDKASHIHVLIGNVIDGKVVKPISQYQATYSMKQGFNRAVKHVLKEDNKLYVPLNENVGDKPLHVSRAEKAEKRERDLDVRESKINELFKREKAKYVKLINSAKKYFGDWLEEINSKEKDQIEVVKKAEKAAKAIVKIEQKSPESAYELSKKAIEKELEKDIENNEEKVSFQVEKEQKNRKRRTRKRTS